MRKRLLSLIVIMLNGMGMALAYNITASTNPSEAGTVTGTGTYEAGATCTLSVTPSNSTFTFVFWSKDGVYVSDSETLSFSVTEDAHYVAEFSYDTYLISAVAVPSEGGTVTVAGGVDGTNAFFYGQTCTLTATINLGCTFVSWTRNGSVVSYDASFSFPVYASGDYEANFIVCHVQTTHLNTGWNWYSTHIEQTGDGLMQLEEALGTNGEVIKSKNQSKMYRNGSWLGPLSNITNETSYRIKTSEACDVTMRGALADPSTHPITLTPGWSWIGYPITEEMTVIEAMANITPSENDVIKSKNKSAIFRNGAWRNSFTITPGMGLMYKSNNTENVILVFPSNP